MQPTSWGQRIINDALRGPEPRAAAAPLRELVQAVTGIRQKPRPPQARYGQIPKPCADCGGPRRGCDRSVRRINGRKRLVCPPCGEKPSHLPPTLKHLLARAEEARLRTTEPAPRLFDTGVA